MSGAPSTDSHRCTVEGFSSLEVPHGAYQDQAHPAACARLGVTDPAATAILMPWEGKMYAIDVRINEEYVGGAIEVSPTIGAIVMEET